MKILITGGAGFIGSHLADRLLARGDQVLVIDNFATGRRDNLTPHANLELVEGHIANSTLMASLFQRFAPDTVIHAAASYKDPDGWEEDTLTNAVGGAVVTKLSVAAGVKRLIYFQTALCYGIRPIEQPITLAHPIRPGDSSYAISKTAAEFYIALSGINYISFRLANAYGPRNLSGPLPTFFHRLTNDKPCFVMDTRRDFIYISDLVDCVMGAIDGKGRRGPYHISSGSDYGINELFDATVAALGITLKEPVEVRPRGADDAYTILLDPKETEADFGWKVTTPLKTGVQKAIDYYKEFGITQTFTHLRTPDKK
ncbi:MAG: NAD-dependent epimerase/dehydratase family protein [Thermodesulfobacteriota bacterium]